MSREKAIEMGLTAYRSDSDARWQYGDALVEYGWKPSEGKGHSSGGLEVIEQFLEELLAAEGVVNVDVHILPDASTLRQYGSAALAIPAVDRNSLGIWVAYEAVASTNIDTALDLIEKIRAAEGRVTRDLIRQYTGRPGIQTTAQKSTTSPLASLPPAKRVEAIRASLKDEDTRGALADDVDARIEIEQAIEETRTVSPREVQRTRRDYQWTVPQQILEALGRVAWIHGEVRVKVLDALMSATDRVETKDGLSKIRTYIEATLSLLDGGADETTELLGDIDAWLASQKVQ